MSETGSGFEPKLFVEKPSDGYLCPLCFNVLKDLKQCPNGHCCCGGCFAAALERRPECPICKVGVTVEKLTRNLFLENMIRGLKMVCISCEDNQSDESTCSWTGPAALRLSHFENDCGFHRVKCPLPRCNELVKRRVLIDHLTLNCVARPVECDDCHLTLLVREVDAHKLECSERLVDCPNVCGLRSTFKQISSHCDTDCPLQTVECSLFKLNLCGENCKGSYLRSQISQHITNQTKRINDSSLNKRQLMTENMKLKSLNYELQNANEDLLLINNEYKRAYERNTVHSNMACQVPTSSGVPLVVNDVISDEAATAVIETDSPISSYLCLDVKPCCVDSSLELPSSLRIPVHPQQMTMKYMFLDWSTFASSFVEHYSHLMQLNFFVEHNVPSDENIFSVELPLLSAVLYLSGINKTGRQEVALSAFWMTVNLFWEYKDMSTTSEEKVAASLQGDFAAGVSHTVEIDSTLSIVLCLTNVPQTWLHYNALRVYLRPKASTFDDIMQLQDLFGSVTKCVPPNAHILPQRMLISVGVTLKRVINGETAVAPALIYHKKFVSISWLQLWMYASQDLMSYFEKNNIKTQKEQDQTTTKLMMTAILMLYDNSPIDPDSAVFTVVRTMKHYLARLSEMPFELEPSVAHRQSRVMRLVMPTKTNIDVTYVVCIYDFRPEWQSHESMSKYLKAAQPDSTTMIPLYELILSCVANILWNFAGDTHDLLAAELDVLVSSILKPIDDERNHIMQRADRIISECIGRAVQYRNKKGKWIPGTLSSVCIESNTCLVKNNANETVSVKLSNSLRLPEFVFPDLPAHSDRHALLKVGDRVEMRHRVAGTWTEVTIKSVDSGDDKFTCVVETDKNKVLKDVHISELREVL